MKLQKLYSKLVVLLLATFVVNFAACQKAGFEATGGDPQQVAGTPNEVEDPFENTDDGDTDYYDKTPTTNPKCTYRGDLSDDCHTNKYYSAKNYTHFSLYDRLGNLCLDLTTIHRYQNSATYEECYNIGVTVDGVEVGYRVDETTKMIIPNRTGDVVVVQFCKW